MSDWPKIEIRKASGGLALAAVGTRPSAGRIATVPVTDSGAGKVNAERLVKAWNSHQELVKALELVRITLVDNHGFSPNHGLVDIVCQALKKAEIA